MPEWTRKRYNISWDTPILPWRWTITHTQHSLPQGLKRNFYECSSRTHESALLNFQICPPKNVQVILSTFSWQLILMNWMYDQKELIEANQNGKLLRQAILPQDGRLEATQSAPYPVDVKLMSQTFFTFPTRKSLDRNIKMFFFKKIFSHL